MTTPHPFPLLHTLSTTLIPLLTPLHKALTSVPSHPTTLWIAGGSLLPNTHPSDIDLFSPSPLHDLLKHRALAYLNPHSTTNATTFRIDNITYQFCHYFHPTLQDLLASFDYAHCQIGAVYDLSNPSSPLITSIETTPAFLEYRLTGCSFYTGSKYPLSSLLRFPKYQDRNFFPTRLDRNMALLSILRDITTRGFSSRADFLSQLDAVDLSLLDDETMGQIPCTLLESLRDSLIRETPPCPPRATPSGSVEPPGPGRTTVSEATESGPSAPAPTSKSPE